MTQRARSVLRGVLGNAAAVTAFRLVADVALLAFVIVLSRRFGAEGMGAYAYSVALAAIVFSIPQYALSHLLVAQGSASPAAFTALWPAVRTLSLLASLVGAAVMIGLAPFTPPETRPVLLLVTVAQLLYNAGEIHRAAFAAHERSGRIGWAELVYKGGIAAIAVPAMLAGLDMLTALIALPVAAAAYFLAITRASRPWRAPQSGPVRHALPLADALRRSAPFLLSVAIAAPIYRLQPVVVAAFAGVAASGLYSAAFKPIETGLLLFGALATALMPSLVRSAAHAREQAALLKRAATTALAIALAGAAAGMLLAPFVVPFIFGAAFEAAVPAFQVLCLVLPATALRNLFLAALTASGRLQRWTGAQAAGLLFATAAALLLVPPFGLMGAAFGLVGGEALACAAAGALWATGRKRGVSRAVPARGTTPQSAASPPRG